MLRATGLAETAGASEIKTKIEGMKSPSSLFGPTTLSERLVSLDAYRGFVMLLMMAEVLRLSRVSRALPESWFWGFLSHHQSHVEWIGCSLHDLIQPSFSFAVGVALPFSLAARTARGQSQKQMIIHAFTRAVILICLGVFLRSVNRPMTYFTFEDTLTQIGLGYGFLFLLGMRSMRAQWIALGVILVGYWLAFALYRLPPPDFDTTTVGVPKDWSHWMSGFAAHWNKNTNLAWRFDVWFLNLFPREKPFAFNGGGYATLSFIPTLGTMILGLIAGNVFRSKREPLSKVKWFVIAGLVGLISGWLIGRLGVCPVVKRIWTPSWVLFSGGWCFLLTAAFYTLIDVKGWKRWAFPLVVIGMNSIAAYCIAELLPGFITATLKTHLGQNSFKVFGEAYEPLLVGGCALIVYWAALFWMYRRKIFLRV
jgi:heparan-alpha-glucosaminide N-acetyltransferase